MDQSLFGHFQLPGQTTLIEMFNINQQESPYHLYKVTGNKHLKLWLNVTLKSRRQSSLSNYIWNFCPDFVYTF